jgi:hypothetical protein
MRNRAFWDIVPSSLFGVDRSFRTACCLHQQGLITLIIEQHAPLKCWSTPTRLQGAISQKALIFIKKFIHENVTFTCKMFDNNYFPFPSTLKVQNFVIDRRHKNNILGA